MEETFQDSGYLQIVMFDLAGEIYGLRLDIVQEVIRLSGMTTVPQTPDFIEGVINLRGFFIPVVDLRKRFGLGSVEKTKSARIMIVEIGENILGIAVDGVLEVTSLSEDGIELPSPLIRTTIKMDYLVGFSEFNGEMLKILDLEKIFSMKEFERLKELEENLA